MVSALMIWLYRLLFLPGLLLALPNYIFRMWRRGGYAKSFQHRFGRFHKLPPTEAGKKRIWLQAVSVGEILAVGPLIDALLEDPTIELVLTTTTSTGYAEAHKHYADKTLAIGIFPLDFWLFSQSAWNCIRPCAIILTESELWPEHLHQARCHNVAAFLVNARISDRSYRRYQRVPAVAASLLRKFDFIYAASSIDCERIIKLGAEPSRVDSYGNIKFDVSIPDRLNLDAVRQLKHQLGFVSQAETHEPFILLGSSTWPGEESALLDAQKQLLEQGVDCCLLLVPRHAERAPELLKLLSGQALAWHQRSTTKTPPAPVKIHLADTTGECLHLTQVADLAFVGKSLPPHHEGQTPIEAAGLGVPILMGPKMSNFKAVCKSLLAAGSAQMVNDEKELLEAILRLAQDVELRTKMGANGIDWHAKNRGSSRRIGTHIRDRLAR